MNAKRTHNVQTPGHAPESDQPEDVTGQAEQGAGTSEPTEKPASPRRARTTEKDEQPAQRSYRDMRADEIDVTKLTAPVLCKEGWLVPPSKSPAKVN